MVAPFAIPKGWTLFRSLDWGFAKPYAVYWYAVDYDGVVYVYRELYGWGGSADTGSKETAAEVARRVRELEDREFAVGYADPACWALTGHGGPSIAEEFAREGIMWNQADNDRLQGKMQVHLRLKEDKIKIFETCRQLIRTLPALCYDPHRVEDVDTNQEDHAYDSLRYGLMSRLWAPQRPKVRPYGDWTDDTGGKGSWMAG